MQNILCDISSLTNEASVEAWFVNPLLSTLGYQASDIRLKTSIQEFRVGLGRRSVNYKPDYIVLVKGFPTLVIDAKSTTENIEDWVSQCSSYCLELNRSFTHNPVKYFLLTNGLKTTIYSWDREQELLSLSFNDIDHNNDSFKKLINLIGKTILEYQVENEQNLILQSAFELKTVPLEELTRLFQEIHQYIWTEEKKTPSAAFMELLKIIFIKIQKDKEIHERHRDISNLKVADITFSKDWITRQTEAESPINDPLFKNLLRNLEREIRERQKKRFFEENVEINLSPRTIEKIVEKLQHIDLFVMDEDVHGRMFESFLDATVRGKELGQYFTPRDVVNLMVQLANPKVTKQDVDSVLDACCGSGGFLISAMSNMIKKANNLVGLTSTERSQLLNKIKTQSIFGIDAGSDPSIYRIARMNMYLHGDGGSNIYFADSLDKNLGQIGKSNIEYDEEMKQLRKMINVDEKKFDIILSNPPFSLKYARENKDQKAILDQYELSINSTNNQYLKTLLSSVMFLERYKDLVSLDGKIFAVIDDSVLSGEAYGFVRDYIRQNFIIIGIISLPGDAFRRSAARVKTSILILRLKKAGEIQSEVFMAKSIYLGLNEKTAKRLGIGVVELEQGKIEETTKITQEYMDFLEGKPGKYAIPASRITDRLDVKYCFHDNGRKIPVWDLKGFKATKLRNILKEASGRNVSVVGEEEYQLLKVNYDGEVLEAELKLGEEISYSTLYKVKGWDILYSNMGVGRGAIGIVPPYLQGNFVSNEYTILEAKSKEEAIFYVYLLRSKEILGDILSSTTGMNRGRIKWQTMSDVDVPVYNPEIHSVQDNVHALEAMWQAYENYYNFKKSQENILGIELELEGLDAKKRWLAVKPPE